MLNAKRFRLREETIALENFGRKRLTTQVPAGSVVTVVSGPTPEDGRMVDVYWRRHKMVMFADDIQKRGEQVADASN